MSGTRLAVLMVGLAVLVAVPIQASQSPAHVYIALQAYQSASPEVKAMIDAAPDAYRAGAAGPDTAYTCNYVRVGLGGHPPGTESHELKTGELCVNMLNLARTPQEKAYALGWLSHWETDNIIHALVNKFGGLYTVDETFHKHLEMTECEHVFSKYVGDQVGTEYIPLSAVTPRVFINSAYAATYPTGGNCEAYKPHTRTETIRGVGREPMGTRTVTDPPVFIDNLIAGADNMETVCRSWVQLHNTGTYSGLWAWGENVVAVKGPPPTKEEYKKLMEPLKIDFVGFESPQDQKRGIIETQYTVQDVRLLAEFCKAWDTTHKVAVSSIASLMSRWAANPTAFQLPNNDLNVGYRDFDPNDPAMAWPGKPDIREMLVFITAKDNTGKPIKVLVPGTDKEWDPTGEWVPCPPAEPQTWGQWVGWSDQIGTKEKIWGGPAGKASFRVEYEGTAPPVDIEVTIKFADKKDKKPYGPEATYQTKKKAELSILFLVDCSGSMAGAKLEAAKAAVRAAVQQTNDGKTEWGLMRYGGCGVYWSCKFVMDPAIMDTALGRLGAGGDTPLTYARGLAIGECASKGSGKRGRVVLLCDGQDNCTEHGAKAADEAEEELRALLPPENIDVPMRNR